MKASSFLKVCLLLTAALTSGCVSQDPSPQNTQDGLIEFNSPGESEEVDFHSPGEDLDQNLEESKTYQDAEEIREVDFECDEDVCD